MNGENSNLQVSSYGHGVNALNTVVQVGANCISTGIITIPELTEPRYD